MKLKNIILFDFVLFISIFLVPGLFLYRSVYSEPENFYNNPPVVISEVRPTGGVGKANDEFVELYNPKIEPVILSGWQIGRLTKNASSTEVQSLFVFPETVVLPAKTHLLVTHSEYQGAVQPDFQYSGQGIADDNSIVLLDGQGKMIDLLGYGAAKNSETSAAEAPSGQLLSIERKPGGNLGNGQDTNNNLLDFFKTQSNPHNIVSVVQPDVVVVAPEEPLSEVIITTTTVTTVSSSVTQEIISSSTGEQITIPVEVESVVVSSTILTVSSTSAAITVSTTAAAVVTTTILYQPGSIYINEVYSVPESGQNEFVELYNNSQSPINLGGWYITDGSNSKTELVGMIGVDEYWVIEKPKGSLNNLGDRVTIFSPAGAVIDRVSYGDWPDGNVADNALAPEIGASLIRVNYQNETDSSRFEITARVTRGQENQRLVVDFGEEKEVEENIPVSVVVEPKPTVKKTEPLYVRIVFPTAAMVGDEVEFDARYSSGGQGQRQYLWETGDGQIQMGEKINHRYTEAGTYSVTVTVSDDTKTEKYKTIKIKISAPQVVEQKTTVVTKQVTTAAAQKPATAKTGPVILFSLISDLVSIKTNTAVRVRGVLAAVFLDEKTTEYYVIGETAGGGSAVGVLVKTKTSDFGARLGDTIEITGKYIVNSTSGNYLQYGASDTLSIIKSGEIITPVSSTIKNIEKNSGGYIQVQGRVVEKNNNNFILTDQTSEIKVVGSFTEIKNNDSVLVAGYLLQTKNGALLRVVNKTDVVIKPVMGDTEAVVINKEVSKNKLGMMSVSGGVLVGLVVIKKYFLHKTREVISATEE